MCTHASGGLPTLTISWMLFTCVHDPQGSLSMRRITCTTLQDAEVQSIYPLHGSIVQYRAVYPRTSRR